MAGSSGRCDPEEVFLAVMLDDGIAQAGDGEILGFDVDNESEVLAVSDVMGPMLATVTPSIKPSNLSGGSRALKFVGQLGRRTSDYKIPIA
jgi:hypothetical protein